MPLAALDKAQATPFSTLMRLEKIGDGRYVSTTRAYEPGGDVARASGIEPRAYGGHVYAQSVWAAAQTVKPGFVCHSVSGNFIQPGRCDVLFEYTIRTLHDGKNFCVRAVDAAQPGGPGVSFTCTCSFKRPETQPRALDFANAPDIQLEYAVVLEGKQPAEHRDPPSADTPWFLSSNVPYTGPPFPGLRSKMVEMAAYNAERPYSGKRQLHYYAVVGDMPSVEEQPNLHAAAHLYASDRNGLYIVSRLLDIQKHYAFTTSLSHSVTFHATLDSIDTMDADGNPKWFVQELWTDRFADSRSLHHSRILDSLNRHIATTLQDGLLRLDFKTHTDFLSTKKALSRNGRL